MGKPTGFLEYLRELPLDRSAIERIRDYNEFHLHMEVKKLRDQGWDIRLKEGTEDYPLVAPQAPGEYLVECTVKCGRGHDDMNMKLIVKN